MQTYNHIGIDEKLDKQRIGKLLIIGLFAGIMVFIGDFILGYGTGVESLDGLERKLSAYLSLSDTQIFISAFPGFIGIPLEGLCYFAIYRMIVPFSEKYAHIYRSGIFGYLIFGGCGVHVPCLACVFFCKYMMNVSSETAYENTI